jgi:hypothetical protein
MLKMTRVMDINVGWLPSTRLIRKEDINNYHIEHAYTIEEILEDGDTLENYEVVALIN